MELDGTNVIAVQLEMPTSIGWAVTQGTQTWGGKSIDELINCVNSIELRHACLSLTLLLPIEFGQAADIEGKE